MSRVQCLPIGEGDSMNEVENATGAMVMRVLNADWPVGEAIRPNQLQADLGVIPNIAEQVRHVAIRMGLFKGKSGAGSLVQPQDQWNHRDPELVRWMLAHNYDVTIRRLLEVREAIEPIAAAHAARRSCEDAREIALLAERIDALGSVDPHQFAENRDQFGATDVLFHTRILTASGNPFFAADATNVKLALEHRLQRCAPPSRGRVVGTASYYPEQPAEIAMIMHIGLAKAICQELPDAAEAMARGIVVEFNPGHGTPDLTRRLQLAADQIAWGSYQHRARPEVWV
ncbi:FadR/GntR family transcriptional regulator [Cryptosporangium minutisporangium]|uniref:GntR C-terminal domain-containing protein n=1 Tax=Cryptosporangium minutisporangium TaxID=113569 RepID=A0ABP6SYD2_9ACTN